MLDDGNLEAQTGENSGSIVVSVLCGSAHSLQYRVVPVGLNYDRRARFYRVVRENSKTALIAWNSPYRGFPVLRKA